jgi:uncharacterized protein (DUF302 family)
LQATAVRCSRFLEQNIGVASARRCRITIDEEGGKTVLAALRPTALLAVFNVPQFEQVAQEVETTILKIMNEAAG